MFVPIYVFVMANLNWCVSTAAHIRAKRFSTTKLF
nr:MAG TPA: hypothetical protein [Caudoviricetes sp.]